ncbi:MAG: DUF6279 family lipoprotein [Nitrosomonadaceae bacterium]|nr:DUF6279 family lipoprotein [Nitrosomonadaceae bacterium]
MRLPRISLRQLLLPLLLLLLSGCSVINIAYNNVDMAIRWVVSDYFDFNTHQQAQFNRDLQRAHTWHRREELPKYAMLCTETARRVEAGLKPADLDWMDNAVEARRETLMYYVAGDLAGVLGTMEPAQFSIMDTKFAKENAKFRKEHLDGTSEALEKKRVKRSLERIEDWVGTLEPGQKERGTEMVKAFPQNAEHRYAHRATRQKMLRELLETRLPKDKLEEGLGQWLTDWGNGRSAEHERVWAQWVKQLRQLMLELDAMLTPKQRLHLTQKLHGYAKDFTLLSKR